MEEVIDYKDQIEEFFVNVKKLNGSRMNTRLNLTLKHIYEVDLEGLFRKVTKFKTTNNKLHLEMKKRAY